MKRRVIGLLVIFGVAICCLSGILFYIQIIEGESLSKAAKIQQQVKVNGLDSRGIIYDRNLNRLTDVSTSYYYAIPNRKINGRLDELIDTIKGEKVGTQGEICTIFRTEYYDSWVNKKLTSDYDAYSFQCNQRYSEKQTAAHFIGYLNSWEKTGASGIEKMYQGKLISDNRNFSVTGDGQGNIVAGSSLNITASSHVSMMTNAVVSTIDINIQKKLEECYEKANLEGAAVVLDCESGQLIAMVSAPTFNPNKIEDYLASSKEELVNKATQGLYPPGSIFKIVTAAAAIENNAIRVGESYNCTGNAVINGVLLSCSEASENGHGTVNLKSAFAKSCNCFFANLGKKVGSEKIIEMAGKMGIGSRTIDNFPNEANGQFPSTMERTFSGLSNLSIGQGSLLVTPIQMAKMTNIIANKGVDKKITILNDNGKTNINEKRVMKKNTAVYIGSMMEEVMIAGTGKNSNTHVKVAGKTGSAETTRGNQKIVHGWFTGYFPAENPKYAVTVLVENGKTGSSSALPIFEEIVNYLY